MHESLYSDKITVYSSKGASVMKVDIIKHETYIEIRLIEIENIFTLFICTISESDFYLYKKEQDILVKYDRFVPILVNLFYKVKNNVDLTANIINKSDKELRLQFIEQNEFRNIVKLELPFQKPEEFQYRKYLGDLLGRMEKDNIALIKENKILREKAIKGDQEKNSKIKYLESENTEIRKRLELMNEELNSIEMKYNVEKEEFYSDKNKISELEKINTQLNYELENLKKANYREKYEEKEKEAKDHRMRILELEHKSESLNRELEEMKKEKRKLEYDLEREFGANLNAEEIKSKLSHLEGRIKTYKQENREKKEKIEQLQSENKSLVKKLENAQNVYNHFLKSKVEDNDIDNLGNYSFEPENPHNK